MSDVWTPCSEECHPNGGTVHTYGPDCDKRVPRRTDSNYDGTPGKPTFGERFATAQLEQWLQQHYGDAFVVDTPAASNGCIGNMISVRMPDEDYGFRITITEGPFDDVRDLDADGALDE